MAHETKKHVVRDLVHGYIFLDESDREVLDQPIVQRLRYIRHNGLSHLVYPSLNTTRFEHSLGVLHLAGEMAKWAFRNCHDRFGEECECAYLMELSHFLRSEMGAENYPFDPNDSEPLQHAFRRAARWYGLFHDVGHLPLSHLMEDCLKECGVSAKSLYPKTTFEKLHEAAAAYIFSDSADGDVAAKRPTATSVDERRINDVAWWLLKRLILNKKLSSKDRAVLQPLKDIIDADIDVDRLDSIARDGLVSKSEYGHIDISRFVRHSILYKEQSGKWRIIITTRALSAVESLLFERWRIYRLIHFKPKVLAFCNAFRHVMREWARSEQRLGKERFKKWTKWWHAKNYVTGGGYLDDGSLLARVHEFGSRDPAVVNAKNAFVFRKNSARPIWKQRDDLLFFTRRIAREAGRTSDKSLSPAQILSNAFLFHPEKPEMRVDRRLQLIEEEVNKRLFVNEKEWRGFRVVLAHTPFKPYEPAESAWSWAEPNILLQNTGDIRPLTELSGVSASLKTISDDEPSFTVTLICPDTATDSDVKIVASHFEALAKELVFSGGRFAHE